ncbi:Hint domain-containing protein [Thalassobius sp. I31.1]|uniref:Hint domain-containing protein n=1 Tax=Thalassobius sp. I31.1 TaxID=2109912 RepID=UPI001E537971|nr:Hint domain-containing protein [Thalassobius sp. I31.1]
MPTRDLLVSRQHRMVVQGAQAKQAMSVEALEEIYALFPGLEQQIPEPARRFVDTGKMVKRLVQDGLTLH